MKYPITEIFHSVQGEGLNVGRSAWFIRLAGCNLACPGCDEPLHDDSTKSKMMTEEEIVAQITEPAELVVITGGEPTMYDLGPLTVAINNLELDVSKMHPSGEFIGDGYGALICIETNGTLKIRGDIDFVCVSPKPTEYGKAKGIPVLEENLQKADEIKVVVGWTPEDEIEALVQKYACGKATIFLSPLTKFPGNLLIQETADRAVELVKKYAKAGVRLSVQIHKWLQVR